MSTAALLDRGLELPPNLIKYQWFHTVLFFCIYKENKERRKTRLRPTRFILATQSVIHNRVTKDNEYYASYTPATPVVVGVDRLFISPAWLSLGVCWVPAVNNAIIFREGKLRNWKVNK